MDLRKPDTYKNETLREMYEDTPQEESCDELELVMLQSMEEEWSKEAANNALWKTYQPLLEKLKRIGNYDVDIKKLHTTLSEYLYNYSYKVYSVFTEDDYEWIENMLKTVRISKIEQENLTKAFTHLRFGL